MLKDVQPVLHNLDEVQDAKKLCQDIHYIVVVVVVVRYS